MTNFESIKFVLSVTPYKFTSKEGELIEGISLFYYDSENLEPTEDGENKGMKPYKVSVGIKYLKVLHTAPAFYEFKYSATSNAEMKMQLKISDIQYLGVVTELIKKG